MKRRIITIALSLGALLAFAGFIAVPRLLPLILSRFRSDIAFQGSTKQRKIFITIDDAPSKNTGDILRVLEKHKVPATFFVIGDHVRSSAQLEQIAAAGQLIGNHLKTTTACSKLSLAEFKRDFDACDRLLPRTTQRRLFRPASDFGTSDQIAYAKSKGYRVVAGTVFPMDHWISSPNSLLQIAKWLAVPGGIVILHDGDNRGQTTATVLDRLLPELKSSGFDFGRLEEDLN